MRWFTNAAQLPRPEYSRSLLLSVVICFGIVDIAESLSGVEPPNGQFSRRELAIVGVGGTTAAYYYAKALEALFDPPIDFPVSHEDRVRRVLQTTLQSAAPHRTKLGLSSVEPLKIMEVGIGSTARLIRRGLYDFESSNFAFSIVGLDPNPPSSKAVLQEIALNTPSNVSIELQQGSITKKTAFPDGYFDAVVCCLTLCSVDDPESALREIKRLIRPNGGSFGFCEHVAAADDSFFGRQQILLDPLQQRIADNCHLHRKTQETIREVFGNDADYLFQENFFVNEMWPVSCQYCGVVQMK